MGRGFGRRSCRTVSPKPCAVATARACDFQQDLLAGVAAQREALEIDDVLLAENGATFQQNMSAFLQSKRGSRNSSSFQDNRVGCVLGVGDEERVE